MERKDPTSQLLLQKIKGFTQSIVEDISKGHSPVLHINRFRNYCSDPSGNSPIPVGDGDGDVKRFHDGDGDGNGDGSEKRR
nr:meiotic recombination protein SPO11-1 [Tanacetum cinerariifolium]